MVASDKLFYWLFQDRPDRIIQLLSDLPADAGGYHFSAPVLKERECRLDGLFLPPEDRPDLPAVVLEAQMAPDPDFLLRLYAESALICPHRHLNFGSPVPVREFLEYRVRWIELQPREAAEEPAAPLTRVLSLLLEPESQILPLTTALREQASADPLAAEVLPLIPAILLARFNQRPIQEICAMGGLTLGDFTQSRAYREIFGQGEAVALLREKPLSPCAC